MLKMVFFSLLFIFTVSAWQAHGYDNYFFINSLTLSDCQKSGQFSVMENGQKALDSLGNTELHLAVLSENKELVRDLLERGDGPNVQNELGDTPLHLAVKIKSENGELVRLLVDAGADPLVPNEKGETALDYVVLDNNVKYIQLLFYRMVQIVMRSEHCTDEETEKVKSIFQLFTM